jgi:hypothetical protein
MNGSLPLSPPTRQHQPHHCGYDSYDDYGYDYLTHSLSMHHSFDTCTPRRRLQGNLVPIKMIYTWDIHV